MNEINVVLNRINVKGNKGEYILSLAKRYGFEIPSLCFDERLDPYSSCFVCVVEIEGMKSLQPACSTRITEGMKIETINEKIFKARKTALELLLSNHYADCLGPCKQTCPAGVDVQGYISYIEKGMYHEAVALIKETNPLPAICGRVCVRPCEVACRRNLLNEGTAVGIDYMKRFAADYDLSSSNKHKPTIQPPTGKKIAIIGAGPGGLSAAFFLRKYGHEVDIYEAAPLAGGWLRYGIPEYRLPNDILQKEVDNITEMGVRIHFNQILGENISYKTLKNKYDSFVLAIGSQKGTSIGCEGDDAINCLSGIDFLKTMELSGKRYDFTGKTVAVVGGGNTAMDCCRSSIRCGAKKVYVIYRRTEKEMPANPIEIHESKLEGVEYIFLTAPVKVNKDKEGKIQSMTCVKMELGEPDASGRRRPVVVEGSEFKIEMDYAIAAIGQKTNINFLDDINTNSDNGELKATKWGDVDANPLTLQTGIVSVFACGDGVSGPATLIQAVAQAKISSLSCHQYLMGHPIQPLPKEFLSKKDNFKLQIAEDYVGKFLTQMREEMPTLNPKERNNFKEVELGYKNEKIAQNEAARCLECGCVEYYDCDLKRFSTEYSAEQNKYGGEFKEYTVDFHHPFIEIDNNKCVLCSRCIRICKEVVGANALGLVKRGFDTYVAPAMGKRLQDTTCESCGLCISACPTGAITENIMFKPGPVKLDKIETICNYCSVGCTITIHHKNGYAMKTTGRKGIVNTDGNICKYAKFGYTYINDKNRITKPLIKEGNRFTEISFEKAFGIIKEKIKNVKADENAFFAGARLSNEEMYLVQKLARAGAKTNQIASFHYLDREKGNVKISYENVPFNKIQEASRIYLLGSEINMDNAVVGFMIQNTRFKNNIPVELITNKSNSRMINKVDKLLQIKSYYYFVKALNHYILSNELENKLFINDNCEGFEKYRTNLLKENYSELVKKAGIANELVINFAQNYNKELNAILVFSEKDVSASASSEIYNLVMLTGKLGKTANGIIALKEKNNSQGLFDMGIIPQMGVGGIPMTNKSLIEKMKSQWGINELPQSRDINMKEQLHQGKFKNIVVFGEDPIGCAIEPDVVRNWFAKAEFVVVQDYFLTDTAKQANLILPATFPFETGGTFTNTQKVIQKFEKQFQSNLEYDSNVQLIKLNEKFGIKGVIEPSEVISEIIQMLPELNNTKKYSFAETTDENRCRLFDYGCDSLVKYFEDKYVELLNKEKNN